MVDLEQAITSYETALQRAADEADDSLQATLMNALLARDRIASALCNSHMIDAALLTRITTLDARLKRDTMNLVDRVESGTLESWRETMRPSADSWWWHLDRRAEATSAKRHVFWTILGGFFLTVSLSLTAEISRRFLSAGSDFIGVFSTLSQAALALLAGSALTRAGHERLQGTLRSLGVRRAHHYYWETGLALAVLGVVFGLRLYLPAIATHYNDLGVRQQAAGRTTSAIESYERAISLNPDYPQAHYNLAVAYEDVLDYDKALIEYQTAIRSDPELYLAYNNLARLYMLRKDDFASALRLLNTALGQHPPPADQRAVTYSLLKNRGWANFGLELYRQAESDLRQALALRVDGAAAHCLLAQVLEADAPSPAGLAEWEACLSYEGSDFVEATWLGLARERLNQEDTAP